MMDRFKEKRQDEKDEDEDEDGDGERQSVVRWLERVSRARQVLGT